MIKLLLTSSGVSNSTIADALMELLGKPISEANALFIPTGIYPFRGGPRFAWSPIAGASSSRMCNLGWKTMGVLELTALPSIDRDIWLPSIEEADALLVWRGDPLFLSYWMTKSGLTELLPSLSQDLVYVGVSAGSMAVASTFAETYSEPRGAAGSPLASEDIIFSTSNGPVRRTLVTAKGMGLTEFTVIPHFENPDHPDASLPNAETWAARLPVPVYAIDDETAIMVTKGSARVVSEGQWKLFTPRGSRN